MLIIAVTDSDRQDQQGGTNTAKSRRRLTRCKYECPSWLCDCSHRSTPARGQKWDHRTFLINTVDNTHIQHSVHNSMHTMHIPENSISASHSDPHSIAVNNAQYALYSGQYYIMHTLFHMAHSTVIAAHSIKVNSRAVEANYLVQHTQQSHWRRPRVISVQLSTLLSL